MRSNALLFTSAVLCASNIPAYAFSWSTQMNCASDYYAYCSMHTAGSPGCHACMRANRQRLSNACVSALIDDGIIPNKDVAQQKSRIAVAKAKPAPPAKIAAVKPTPEATPSVANPELSARPETIASEPEPQTPPPQQSVEATLAIDQQTFEALKNRAPYFLPTKDIASIFAQTEENTSSWPPSPPR